MQDWVEVMGLVLKAEPIGEYDKRVVILTRERGKISAFARGARRQNSKFLAAASPFVFGTFRLLEGKNSWYVQEIAVSSYFEPLRTDFEGACYGMYFLELCDFCTRENNDEKEVLKLLYQSLRALTCPSLDRKLVRAVFEIKLVVVNGEFPGIPTQGYENDTLYALRFIETTPVERLYTFTVSDSVLAQLAKAASEYRQNALPGRFKSLEVLESL